MSEEKRKPYILEPKITPLPSAALKQNSTSKDSTSADSAFIRAEHEDDDGYDPYSDRPAKPEAQFQENPWD